MLEATGPIDDPTLDRTRRPRRSWTTWPTRRTGSSEPGRAQAGPRRGGPERAPPLLAGTDPVASFRALADAGAGGHLIVHSTDPEVQAALEAAVAGTVEAPGGRPLRRLRVERRRHEDRLLRPAFAELSRRSRQGRRIRTAEQLLAAENTAPKHPDGAPCSGRIREQGSGRGCGGVRLDVLRPRLRIPGSATLDGKPQGLGVSS